MLCTFVDQSQKKRIFFYYRLNKHVYRHEHLTYLYRKVLLFIIIIISRIAVGPPRGTRNDHQSRSPPMSKRRRHRRVSTSRLQLYISYVADIHNTFGRLICPETIIIRLVRYYTHVKNNPSPRRIIIDIRPVQTIIYAYYLRNVRVNAARHHTQVTQKHSWGGTFVSGSNGTQRSNITHNSVFNICVYYVTWSMFEWEKLK